MTLEALKVIVDGQTATTADVVKRLADLEQAVKDAQVNGDPTVIQNIGDTITANTAALAKALVDNPVPVVPPPPTPTPTA